MELREPLFELVLRDQVRKIPLRSAMYRFASHLDRILEVLQEAQAQLLSCAWVQHRQRFAEILRTAASVETDREYRLCLVVDELEKLV